MRTLQVIQRSLSVLIACAAVGCGSESLNPYGRAYSDSLLMKPGPLLSCLTEKDFDIPPFLNFGSLPIYPLENLLSGKIGVAKVYFTVSDSGVVQVVKYETQDDKYFANHAAIAMRDWRVTPAIRNGIPVGVTCKIEFSYE